MAAGDFKVLQAIASVNMPCGGTVNYGEPVKISSGAIVVAGDGETVVGIALTSGVSGETIAVLVTGVVQATAASGVNFAPADLVYLATSATLDAGSTGNKSVGAVVNTDPSTAGTVQIYLHSSIMNNQFTHA